MVASRGPVTSGVTLAMIVVATVFVLARFYTRIVLVRSVKQDDWWILAAWLCAVGFSAAICVGVSDGLGMHWDNVVYLERDNFRRAQYAYSILYNPCLMLTKNSIIVFYLSVMSKDADPVFRWCNWITLAIVNIAGLALTCLNIFQCRPISAGYTYPTPDGAKCADIVTLYLSSAPVNIITDLALLLLPMPILTGLRLPKKQKIILVCTFSAGIFVAVVDVVRIAYLQNAALESLDSTTSGNGNSGQRVTDNTDFSWDASLSFMWSAIEVSIGIICACVPSLKPLFLKFAPNLIKDEGDISPVSSMDLAEKQEPLSTFDTDVNVLTHPAAFRKPAVAEYEGDDDGDFMGFLNMLAKEPPGSGLGRNNTSSMATSKPLSRTTSAVTQASEFGFVKMDKNKNMLKLNNRQSFWAVAVVTFVFFLWGFAYGLLDVLNSRFQQVLGLSYGKSLGLRGAYYAGYLVGPFSLGRFLLHRYGFKSTMIAGLCVYGCGTLVFWPSAVLLSYPAFCVSNFIVGFGLSCLEVSSNPYIALCGPLEYAEVRLNFSQAFQAVGSVCSPILAQRVLFKNVVAATSLVSTQWAYLGISLFDFALAIAFYYIPLPEANEEQLEAQADKRSSVYRTRIGPFRVTWVTLALGAFCQWCYVGAQEGNATLASGLLTIIRRPGMPSTLDLESINRTSFALGRFVGCFLNYMIKPRWLLVICFVGSIALTGAQMGTDGGGAIANNNLIYFFEGSIFPIVYAISMRGMGDQTFNAAAIMTAAISSGAVIPPISWAVTNLKDSRYAYSVILAIFCFGAIFPIYLNFLPAARKQVDPVHDDGTKRRRTKRPTVSRSPSAGSEHSSMVSIDKKFGLMGIVARRKKHYEAHKSGPSFMPSSEHVETMQIGDDSLISPVSPKTNTWNNDSKFGAITRPDAVRMPSSQSNIDSLSSWQRGDAIMEEEEDDDEEARYEQHIDRTPEVRRSSTWSERRPSFWGRGVGGGSRRKSQWEQDREREQDAEADARRASQWQQNGTGRRQSRVSFVDVSSEESSVTDKRRRSRSLSPKHEETEEERSDRNTGKTMNPDEHFEALMSGGSGEELTTLPTQEKRPWTEEDDVREDYHKILRDL